MLFVIAAATVVATSTYIYIYIHHTQASVPRAPLLAGFPERSYRPGQVADLRIEAHGPKRVTLQLFLAGGSTGEPGSDGKTYGKAVTSPRELRRPAGPAAWVARIHLGAGWPSGDYVARLSWRGGTDYAPFVLRPRYLAMAPVLVVEPTNTWHAYDSVGGDSWYMNSNVHVVDLTHPFSAYDVKGRAIAAGLPKQFATLDLGFLRWYWKSGNRADFFSDDDLEQADLAQLLEYRLIVFAGHEEYVTSHVYDLITAFRDAGGNLAFLTANSFYYRVFVHGNTMRGRTKWRDLGRPEAALVGAQYVGWDEGRWPNKPYRVVDTAAAPWLFAGTGMRNGSTFGRYGIEIDEPNGSSPPGTKVIAAIPHEFGSLAADMTIYTKGRSTVFDAGAYNFAESAPWGNISRMVSNLWRHLSR